MNHVELAIRNAEIVKQFLESDLSAQQIAEKHGMSRVNVANILKKANVTYKDTNRFKQAAEKRESRLLQVDDRTKKRDGVSREVWKEIGTDARNQFRYNRNYAQYANIPWELTLGQWWDIWQKSGHWNDRGTGHGYVLSRNDKLKGFSIGNVEVISASENLKRIRMSSTTKNGARGGVYHVFPHLKKGWIARHGNKHLGYFESEEAARAAKTNYSLQLNDNKKTIRIRAGANS